MGIGSGYRRGYPAGSDRSSPPSPSLGFSHVEPSQSLPAVGRSNILRLIGRPRRASASRSRKIVRPVRGSGLACEALEQRTLLSFPPLPVVPSNGEFSNLQNAIKFAQRQQTSAWDNQPIPFAVVGTN